MNIILFGPPGVGKSTIIGYLKTLGQRAVDLEDIDSKLRFQLPNSTDSTFFGGADLSPNRKYPNAIRVFLDPGGQAEYEQRRKQRDARFPEKANQRAHSVDEWRSIGWDYMIRTDNMSNARSPRVVAQHLIRLMEDVSSGKEWSQYGGS